MAGETFEMLSKEELAKLKQQEEVSKIDSEWSERISNVPVGAGWKMSRPEEENQRNFKRRINDAAKVSFRTLDWTPQETNLPAGQEPRTYVIRVKAIDLKAKQAAEAARANGSTAHSQNGTQEAPQTPSADEGSAAGSSEETPAQGRRR